MTREAWDLEPTCDCPVCFGERGHDPRDTDALLAEHLSDLEILAIRGGRKPVAWIECDECEGTGVVTCRRAAVLAGAAAAAVDQALARLRHEGLVE